VEAVRGDSYFPRARPNLSVIKATREKGWPLAFDERQEDLSLTSDALCCTIRSTYPSAACAP